MYGSPSLSPPHYAAPPVAADPPPVGQPALSFNPLAFPSRDYPARSFVIESTDLGWSVVFYEGPDVVRRALFARSPDAFDAGNDWVLCLGEPS